MRHHAWWQIPALAGALCLVCGFASGDEDVASALRNVVIRNEKAQEARSPDALMKTIHSQSPGYLDLKQEMATTLENYQLKPDLVSFQYIGTNGEYAVGEAKMKTIKVSGLAYQDNEQDVMLVFRKEDGQWKMWASAVLEIKFINEPNKPSDATSK